MKKIAFFDLDGTVSDSGEGIVNAITYAEEKLKYTPVSLEDKRSCIGPPLARSFMRLYGLSFEDAEHMINVYREYYTVKGIYENVMYEGIKELFEHLTLSGWELRICSAKPTGMVETVLKHFDVYKYFTSLTGAEMHGDYPGKAVLIKNIIEREKPEKAVMIGDRRDDIEGGKANNIASIGVLWGYGSEEELKNAGATHIVSTSREIADILSRI
jgi:phosphoglycolate phosphatase